MTDKRNNAIKPVCSFIRVPLGEKRKCDLARRWELKGRTSCWDLCHTRAPSASSFTWKRRSHNDQLLLSPPSPLMAPEHSCDYEQQTPIRAATSCKISRHFLATPWQRHRSKTLATSLAGRGCPDSRQLVSSKWMLHDIPCWSATSVTDPCPHAAPAVPPQPRQPPPKHLFKGDPQPSAERHRKTLPFDIDHYLRPNHRGQCMCRCMCVCRAACGVRDQWTTAASSRPFYLPSLIDFPSFFPSSIWTEPHVSLLSIYARWNC